MAEQQDTLSRRKRVMGSSPLFYDEPLVFERGEGIYLYTSDGRRYLDCYNNIPGVGHCNPHVVSAMARQSRILNVHSRYVSETVIAYAERLLGTFANRYDQVMFTCTGSESNDQALRIARMLGRGRGIICTNFAYHGNTAAVDQVSPLFRRERQEFTEVRTVPYPDSYRPIDGLEGEAAESAYLARIQEAIDSFNEVGVGFAGMIFCSIFANEGLPNIPAGFLAKVTRMVHAAGGLVIADEVQAGFGRTGTMWGHELMGFVPDIVTMGKPMGNGYPISALVSRSEIIDEFRNRVFYFNTFAGAQVGVAAANAVLDVLEQQDLLAKAHALGGYLRQGFARLAARHDLIADIRGAGLWVGVELVRDRTTKEPATEETQRLKDLFKDAGILLNSTGEFDNVLKIRPPLIFNRENADELLEQAGILLARV